ncbi:MAG: YbaB/EbfC family nucleoid-associated protein [Planctomycetes bacterium]|nr:YbaB/EbfC family nucleoid-associated protein [Planctomycetota bacterium]MCW8136203.1 YbaB/EbfC family nucleoid-associated protein [Planctomycetota bacterium]
MAGLGNFSELMKQAQRMQRDMGKVQEELKERYVEGSAGDGLIKVICSGAGELVKIEISADAVDTDDMSLLEDLVIAAVNAGLKKAEELRNAEMSKVTGGMNLPGMF